MNLIKSIKNSLLQIKRRLKENRVDSLLRILNAIPNLAGFSINEEKSAAPFWIVHCSLLFYIYGVGNLVYQTNFANGASDFIKSYVNVTLLVLITNNTYWWLQKKSLLTAVLRKIKKNEELARSSPEYCTKLEKLHFVTKCIILIIYSVNYMNEFLIYLPHRVDVNNDFSMTPCFGLEPLDKSPNREICLIMLCVQELTICIVVINYQALLMFLICHTSAMYRMLSEEMEAFNSVDVNSQQVKEKLPILIGRHVLTLDIVDNLKSLYGMPIGINFASNAVCICLFFYFPLEEWLGFIPILIYCLLIFFLYCYLCQQLENSSELFERAVYSCGWENFQVKERKSVYVMLLVAQKKVVILAADIIPVNMYAFATTLQAMFKFVTVVKV